MNQGKKSSRNSYWRQPDFARNRSKQKKVEKPLDSLAYMASGAQCSETSPSELQNSSGVNPN